MVSQGRFFSCSCQLQEGNIASHPTLLLGSCQSCPLWQVGLGSLPPPKHYWLSVPPAGQGALNEAMVEQLGVVWHEALQPISSR